VPATNNESLVISSDPLHVAVSKVSFLGPTPFKFSLDLKDSMMTAMIEYSDILFADTVYVWGMSEWFSDEILTLVQGRIGRKPKLKQK
jgi:hypothetical protein